MQPEFSACAFDRDVREVRERTVGGADPQGVVGLLALVVSGVPATWLNTFCLLVSQAELDVYPLKPVWNVPSLPLPSILIVCGPYFAITNIEILKIKIAKRK